MKNNINETMRKYTAGEITVEEANQVMKEAGASFHLGPERNELTEAEKRVTTVGFYPEQANGFGLLDTGTGTMEKVHVVDGKLETPVNEVREDGSTNMLAFVHICGRCYAVKGRNLVEG